jgi:WD40 repeat protein
VDTLCRVVHEEPLPVRALRPRVPRDLETICLKCLQKNPRRRYASAAALAEDLRHFQAGEPVAARPVGAGERLWRWVRRNPGWAAMTASTAALLLLIAVSSVVAAAWFAQERRTAQRAQKEATEQRQAALDNLGRAEQAEHDQREKLWQSYVSEARARLFSRRPGQRFETLAALGQAARIRTDPLLRDLAIDALALPDVRLARDGEPFPPGSGAVVFDDAYRLYAADDPKGGALVRRVSDHQIVRRLEDRPTVVDRYTFSPDGRFLAVRTADGFLSVRRVEDGHSVLREKLGETPAHAFHPDGRQLAVAWGNAPHPSQRVARAAEGVLRGVVASRVGALDALTQGNLLATFDLTTGQEVSYFFLPAPAHRLALSPDGRRLAVGHVQSATTHVLDAATGRVLAALPVGPLTWQTIAWHPDGERLAVAGGPDPRVQIWDVAGKRRLAFLVGHVQQVTVLTFHPDGRLLASTSWDGTVRLWEPETGRQVLQLIPPPASLPAFSRDGRWLGYGTDGDKARLLEVASGQEYRTLVSRLGAGQGGYYYGDFSPDGRLLALGMDEGTRLWDVESGRELADLRVPAQVPYFRGREGWTELLISGHQGLFRWRRRPGGPGEPDRLGPPERLSTFPFVGLARDQRTLVGADRGRALQVLDAETAAVRQMRIAHPDLSNVPALSPDARQAATYGWHSPTIRVWDVATGKLVRELAVGRQTTPVFTPDGRHLLASRADEYVFYDTGSWEPVRRLRRAVSGYPGRVAFSPDGRLMALPTEPAVLQLSELATGRAVARLEDPFADRTSWVGFSPDGTRLASAAIYNQCVHVWDLRLIRRRLTAMGLDWEWPEFPAANLTPGGPPPRFVVDPGPFSSHNQR